MRILQKTALIGLLALSSSSWTSSLWADEQGTTDSPGSQPVAVQVEDAEEKSAASAEERSAETGRHVGPKVAVGNSVTLKAGQVAEAVVVVNGSATIEGDVEDAVVIVLGKGRVNGKVKGDVVTVLSDLELGPNADISGQVVRVGGSYRKDPGAQLRGEDAEVAIAGSLPGYAWFERNIFEGVLLRPLPPGLAWAWAVGIAFIVLHLVVLLLMARPVQACSETLRTRPVRSFFVGFLAYLLFIPLLVLLSWTVIGVPVLVCALIGASLLGKTAVYRVAGGQLLQQVGLGAADQPLLGWLIGTVVFYVLYMVPILGWVVWFILAPLGVGTAVTAAFAHFQRERVKPPGSGEGEVWPASGSPTAGSGLVANLGSPGTPPPISPAVPAAGVPLAALPPLSGTGALSLSSAELASLPRVGFWPRLGATLLDILLLGIICGMTSAKGSFFLFLLAAYHIGMWGWRGTTLGGAVFGLRCVRLDGRALDWQIAVVRAIASFVSLAPCGLGFFWASWTSDRQSWHDIIAGTTIVKMPKPFSLM